MTYYWYTLKTGGINLLKRTYLNFPLMFIIILILSVILAGCNAFKKSEAAQEPNYKELKQMVIDILQTEEGKKAVQESIEDPQVKKKMVLDTTDVQKIIQEEFFSPENKEKLKSMFEDPKFASELGKTLKKENEKLLKDLMKDPEYRKMMVEVMKEKEFEKMLMDIMKSNAYRTQMMLVIKESLESPMFKYDLLKLMEKASEEALKPDKEKKKEGGDEQEGEGG